MATLPPLPPIGTLELTTRFRTSVTGERKAGRLPPSGAELGR